MKHTPSRAALAVTACLAVMLAGVVAVTPAGATLQHRAAAAATHNWNKIWKNEIRPKADRRYYTKEKARDRFAEEADVHDKAASDARYALKDDVWSKLQSDGRYYSKDESDEKYTHKQGVYRGVFLMGGPNAAGYQFGTIDYGVALAAAPTAHYIKQGDSVPAGCSGNAGNPGADPGHLCVFEAQLSNMGATRTVTNLAFTPQTASPNGAFVYAATGGAGYGYAGGSWALRPGGAAVVVNHTLKPPSLGPTVGSPK